MGYRMCSHLFSRTISLTPSSCQPTLSKSSSKSSRLMMLQGCLPPTAFTCHDQPGLRFFSKYLLSVTQPFYNSLPILAHFPANCSLSPFCPKSSSLYMTGQPVMINSNCSPLNSSKYTAGTVFFGSFPPNPQAHLTRQVKAGRMGLALAVLKQELRSSMELSPGLSPLLDEKY